MESAVEETIAGWSSSVNWIVSDGSLDGSISFESSTSSSAVDVIPSGVFLLRPPTVDSPPCEVTIHFRSKHEIHQVYVRSTARVYEIYYAPDHKDNSNEYLCTVRCGEVTSCSDNEGRDTESDKGNNGTTKSPEQIAKSDCSVGDEDGWVEVKNPDSPQLTNKSYYVAEKVDLDANRRTEIHFEATAEISDASPCVSLTIRLLSIKNKACVHVEEIYIYADPVESTSPHHPENLAGNTGGSSLLAMLVPGLLQLPKPGASRKQDRYSLDDLRVQKGQYGPEKAAESCLDKEKKIPQEVNTSNADHESILHEVEQHTKEKVESKSGLVSDEKSSTMLEQSNRAYNRVEKVLDELVLRVGNIEAFCSRFEENMMKPLNSIEVRLQRLEQQLDAFAGRAQSSEPFTCSKISAPEFSGDESESDANDSFASQPVKGYGLFYHELFEAVDAPAPGSATEISPCMLVKAPEFSNEEEGQTRRNWTGHDAGDVLGSAVKGSVQGKLSAHGNIGNISDSVVKDPARGKKFLSIDGALASALEAFLSSATAQSPRPSRSVRDKSSVLSHGKDNVVCSSTLSVPSEGSGNLPDDIGPEMKGCDSTDSLFKEINFDDTMSSAENLNASASHSQKCPGMVITAPEYLTEEDDCFNSHDNSDPWARDDDLCHSASASLLSPAKEAFIVTCDDEIHKSKLIDSVHDPSEGAKISGMKNQEKYMSGNSDPSQLGEVLLHREVMEHRDLEARQKHNVMDVPVEESHSVLLELSLEQKEQIMNWQECSSADEFKGVLAGDLYSHIVESKTSNIFNGHNGGWAIDSDDEEAPFEALWDGEIGGRWNEDSCTRSSSDDSFMKNNVHAKWSDKNSMDSIYQIDGHLIDDFASTRGTTKGTSRHSISSSDISIGHNHETSKSEAEWTLNCGLGYDYPLLDVKFSPKQHCSKDTSLEILLGESSGAMEQSHGNIFKAEERSSSPFEDFALLTEKLDQLLLEVEDLQSPSEATGFDGEVLHHVHGSSTQPQFSSLI